MKNSTNNQELKRIVGSVAAELVTDDMVCGIGTGSTVTFFITELGRRIREEDLRITGVPTSFQSRLLCREAGIPIRELADCAALDLAIDGADEVDPGLNAIKGGGAAHTREKVVAAMAAQFVLIVDQSKLVPVLGTGFPVPIEIIPVALSFVIETIKRLGGDPQLRMGIRKDGPVVTDNGQFVLDARFPTGTDLRLVDRVLHQTPGVVDTGLFFDLANKVLVGQADSLQVQTLLKK
jgi:ribose 5-phosphate isomerase A